MAYWTGSSYRIGNLISADNLALCNTYVCPNPQLPVVTSPDHATFGEHISARPAICIASKVVPEYCAKLIVSATHQIIRFGDASNSRRCAVQGISRAQPCLILLLSSPATGLAKTYCFFMHIAKAEAARSAYPGTPTQLTYQPSAAAW